MRWQLIAVFTLSALLFASASCSPSREEIPERPLAAVDNGDGLTDEDAGVQGTGSSPLTDPALPGFAPPHERAEPGELELAALPAPLSQWPVRYRRCEVYRADIERAVSRWWGAYPYPDAWAAQIYQESLCDPWAISPAGAAGLAQFMPATWREQAALMGLTATPHDDIAIEAGAAYQARMMAVWHARRAEHERWRLGLASYNAGAGNIIRAQTACGGARHWRDIEICLPQITGHHSAETRTYVVRIERWWAELAQGDPARIHPEIRETAP